MPPLTLDRLHDIAGRPDAELRMAPDRSALEERDGSWSGRVMRNLKIAAGADREAQQTGYRLAKVAVLQALIDAYGEEIGTKAFRAGVGRPLGETGWQTSADHPVTGRHIERMLREAETLANPGLAGWMAGQSGDGPIEQPAVQRGRPAWPREPGPLSGVRATLADGLEKSFAERLQILTERRSALVGALGREIGPRRAAQEAPHPADFWVASIALAGGRRAEIGLALSTADSATIRVRDHDGSEAEVPRDGIAQWLEDRAEALGGRLESVRHARLAGPPEPPPLEPGERDGQPVLDAGGLLDAERRDAIAGRLADGAARDRQSLGGEAPQGFPPTLARRLEGTHLTLQAGGHAMRVSPRHEAETLVRLSQAGGLTMEQSWGLARFLQDDAFQDAYRTACARLGGEGGRARAVAVEVAIEGDRLALTFRAPLPGSLVVPFHGDRLSGNELDLALTVSVPRDRLTEERPEIVVDALRIEPHAEPPLDDDLSLPPEPPPPRRKADPEPKAGDGGTAAWIQEHWLGDRTPWPERPIWRPGGDGPDLDALALALAQDVRRLPDGAVGVWILSVRTNAGESEMIGFKIRAGEPPLVDVKAMDARVQLEGLDGLAGWLGNFARSEDIEITGPLLPLG
ncbi:MAG: hypothetical protein U1E53_15900 [Dongiaceae bacterium]